MPYLLPKLLVLLVLPFIVQRNLSLNILCVLKLALPIRAFYLVHHIPTQGRTILQRATKMHGDGVSHNAQLHRSFEYERTHPIVVPYDTLEGCYQRFGKIRRSISTTEITHIKPKCSLDKFTAIFAVV